MFECQPLKTLKEATEWTTDSTCISNKTKQSTVCLRKKRHIDENIPKTLVCHDMRGGYLEDRYTQGDSDEKSYNFYHWQLIDTFVYFSHNFITIPPVTWINAAHKNGVRILGTFITEWDDGYARCEEFLSSESSFQALADKLVTMTTYYRFDGWLINIENKIQEEKVSMLCRFVRYLTVKLHEVLPGSLVIWYDSVISTGELKWQDQLNENNSMFFDACDGIFLNYCWNTEKLLNSKTNALSKNRPFDVYVGIDVFGRGCLGDGGFNTIEALQAVRQNNLSAAIFAQGWVYEKYGKDNFIDNENRFWDTLSDLCPTSLWSNCSVSTSFCLGAGQNFYVNGHVLSDITWYNLNVQEVQPFYRRKQSQSQNPLQAFGLEPCFDCAYLGGSCLKYQGELPCDNTPQLFRLFDLDIKCSESYILSFTYKTKGDNYVFMEMEGNKNGDKKRFLFSADTTSNGEFNTLNDNRMQGTSNSDSSIEIKRHENVLMYPQPIEDVLKNMNKSLSLPEKDNDWETRWYTLDSNLVDSLELTSVSCGIVSKSREVQTVHIGQVQIFPSSLLRIPTITMIQCRKEDDIMCISWSCSHPDDVSYYIVYQENGDDMKYLGRSTTTVYLVPDLQLTDSVVCGIQAVLNIGLVTDVTTPKKSQ